MKLIVSKKLKTFCLSYLLFPSSIYCEIFCSLFDKWRDRDLLRLGWFHRCWRQELNPNFLTSLSFSENKIQKLHISTVITRISPHWWRVCLFYTKKGILHLLLSSFLVLCYHYCLLRTYYVPATLHWHYSENKTDTILASLWRLSSGETHRQ